ncbi:tRNA1(Val) (adenine(37)-N6)-methyltransferase [Cognatishimia sp. F0-27]|uniref:tRNA1(Val) (adenine(37)-N6)-methyltransferase n=1 Tax=Cognatishimia sp. F0-27 TaxID=2816855 RepID=UPI001D0CCFEA|nr:methyltransferase [Cognatishimia sp. F0-27]
MKADAFDDAALTRDSFLGGRVTLLQPRVGYRAGVDPVLLAASVSARPGQSVLDLGCGAAPALCCLATRVEGLALVGLELQPAYAALARRNLALNALSGDIYEGTVSDPPKALRQISVDHVIANPPYFDAARGKQAEDTGRGTGRAGETPLEDWVRCAAKRLKPGGACHVILRAERLPELITAMDNHLGALTLLPLLPREGRAPRLVLMSARKGGRSPFRYRPALVLHKGTTHAGDREAYTDAIRAVLRDGASLPMSE